jgi:transcriptional regulator with XRE-family HTH domain
MAQEASMAPPHTDVKGFNQPVQPALIVQLTRPPVPSLSDVAREANCSVSFVSACAHGRRRPTKRVREAAERLFGRPADELFPHWPDTGGDDAAA